MAVSHSLGRNYNLVTQGWIKTVTKWSPKILDLFPTLATVQRQAPVLALNWAKLTWRPLILLTQWPQHPNQPALWRRALDHSGPWATADDPRYPSPSAEPWPLNPTSSHWEQVSRAAGQLRRYSEGASSLQRHKAEGSSPWPKGFLGRTQLRVRGSNANKVQLLNNHREGMWTMCAVTELHNVATFHPPFRMKLDEGTGVSF